VSGGVTLVSGARYVLALIGTDGEPLPLPQPDHIDARIDATVESWRRWSALIDYEGPRVEMVRRSALALKALLFEPGGAIAAAATTSLPEAVGGTKNWDYRFAWVRDSSFTVDAFIELALHEEVHAAVSWLLAAVRRSAPDLHVFYTLGGELPGDERDLDVPGYRQSRPVRAGNGAAQQSQLGTYGDLFDTVWRYVGAGHVLDHGSGQLLADLADRCCDRWMNKDSGLWELPQREHYTISKIGCWVALDRATRLAEAGHLPDEHAPRWRAEATSVRQWISANCWSESKQAYILYAGSDKLDAAVLLTGRTGFDRGPRLKSTIEAVIAELGRGPYLYRYSGMQSEEGAFVACTFWLVDALIRTGQFDRAASLMDEAVAFGNDLGLLSEQVDPNTGECLGNVPQGLSHLALINAAHALNHARPPERADQSDQVLELR
jgi:GH15 family glucan-1,4-alpha-glucosidase